MWASVIAVVAAVVYLTAIPGDMVYDDVIAVKENRDVRPHSPVLNIFRNDFWGTPIHKVSRLLLLPMEATALSGALPRRAGR